MYFISSQTDPTRPTGAEFAPATSSRAACSSAWPAEAGYCCAVSRVLLCAPGCGHQRVSDCRRQALWKNAALRQFAQQLQSRLLVLISDRRTRPRKELTLALLIILS